MNLCLLLPFMAVVVLIYFYGSFKQFLIQTKYFRKLPTPPATSVLVGNVSMLFDTPENIFKTFRKWAAEYYPLYRIRAGLVDAACLLDPHDFETVMSNTQHNVKGDVYSFLHDWLGTGLLTSNGDKWQERRKILTPSFHFNILQEFMAVFTEETKNLVEVLRKECHRPFVPITDYISDFTLNTIAATAMGADLKQETGGRDYKMAVREIGDVFVYRICRPWLSLKCFYFFSPQFFKEKRLLRTLHTFTNRVISKRQENFTVDQEKYSYSKRKRLAMLDLLLTAKQTDFFIDDDGIKEEVNTFMFEGHDTTSVAISFALMLIACHRDVQDKIYDEIQRVVREPYNLDYKTLQDLKYTERCIKEVLRIYPSVPFISRLLGEDIVTGSGYKLKAGSRVHLHIYDLHHNSDIYPDPEKFDPDRFLPENTQNRHNFAYAPFSAGSRNCIGQKFAMLEMKTLLYGVLSEFILEPVDTPSTVTLAADLVLRSKDSIKVRFVPRSQS